MSGAGKRVKQADAEVARGGAFEDRAVFDFSLDGAEIDAIHALARPNGRIVNPGIGRRGGIGGLILAVKLGFAGFILFCGKETHA